MSKEKLLLKSGGKLQFAPTALQWFYSHTRSREYPYIPPILHSKCYQHSLYFNYKHLQFV